MNSEEDGSQSDEKQVSDERTNRVESGVPYRLFALRVVQLPQLGVG
jgi:hypothetical protein